MRGLRFLLLTITALAAFTAYMIMNSTDPATISTQLKLLLYGSMFITSMGGLALFRVSIHPWVRRTALEPVPTLPILRQAAILASIALALLSLQALRSLNWLDAVLIIVAALLFEMFFRVRPPIRAERQV